MLYKVSFLKNANRKIVKISRYIDLTTEQRSLAARVYTKKHKNAKKPKSKHPMRSNAKIYVRDGIFKLLRCPGIDSKESIQPAYGPVRQPYPYLVPSPPYIVLKFQLRTEMQMTN
jgi:hypothetical protein